MFYMTNKLGAWQIDGDVTEGKVSFKLFFPDGFDPEIKSIRVAGDFQHLIADGNDWDFEGGPLLSSEIIPDKGTLWSYTTEIMLPAGFYEYKYFVKFNDDSNRIVSDPCTRYGGTTLQNAAFVVGGSQPGNNIVKPLMNGRKHLRDLIIYEIHIDDFSDEYRGFRAPLDAVTDKLDYLTGLGFNAILFMPWTAWKHQNFDWGYEPYQYFSVEYRYANDLNHPEEKISWLKKLITACHDRDIHVIMDGVFNHVSVDFPYKKFYRDQEICPYTGDFGGAFPGLQDLDFNNTCTQEFIRDVCLYWIETFKIDGIRFDNTVNFHVSGKTKGLSQLLNDLHEYLKQNNENNFSLTLEHIEKNAADLTNKTKANSFWDNALYEKCSRYLWNGQIDSDFLNSLNDRRYLKSENDVPTTYISNHDHAHVGWKAGAKDNVGAMKWYKTQPYVIALYTCPATPMIQNGQEFAEDYWIPENDEGTGRRVTPRPLHWKRKDDKYGEPLIELYKTMAQIRNKYSVLRNGAFIPDYWEKWQNYFNPQGLGIDTANQIVIYRRNGQNESGAHQEFVIVLNFSDFDRYITVIFPESGHWIDLLSGYDGSWQTTVHNNRLSFQVGSNWGHVFFKASAY
jgi:pullulanase